jgi:alpha-L-rhamnosidase
MDMDFINVPQIKESRARRTARGVESESVNFVRKEEEKKQLEGKWIWLPSLQYPEYQNSRITLFCDNTGMKFAVVVFQKTFELEGRPKEVKIRISADTKYKLFVNGNPVGFGPAECGGDYGNCDRMPYRFYEVYEDTGCFGEGKNVITVQVLLGPEVQADFSTGYGGFWMDGEIVTAHQEYKIVSDRTWKVSIDGAYRSIEEYDGTKRQKASETGYDDDGWENAEEKFAANEHVELRKRPIPLLMYAKIMPKRVWNLFERFQDRFVNLEGICENKEVTVKYGEPVTFFVDYGRIYSGRISFMAEGATGTKITLNIQEIEGKTEKKELIILGEGKTGYESIHLHSVRFIQVTVHNMLGDVKIQHLGVNFQAYPVSIQGEFHCDKKEYEEIYEAGMYTNLICRQNYHMDSPIHQEPLGCTGDYMIESLMNYYTFGDPYLTRLDILRTAEYLKLKDNLMFHASYSLLWIQMIRDYMDYTGDTQILQEVIPQVDGVIQRFTSYLGENGIIEHAPNYMFMDWVPVGNCNLHHPPKCMGQGYLTAFFIGALNNTAELYRRFGRKEEEIDRIRKLSDKIAGDFRKLLWREERGLYCDGLYDPDTKAVKWMPADVKGEYFSQHTNTLAVLYDIAPVKMQRKIMEKVAEDSSLTQAQPYFLHFVLDAFDKAGLFETFGLKYMERWKDLLAENPYTLKEVWNGFDCDFSHAWGGTPTYQLPAKIFGIRPAAYGFQTVSFEPRLPADWNEASTKIPTPLGIISSKMYRVNGEVKAEIEVPGNMKVVSKAGEKTEIVIIKKQEER